MNAERSPTPAHRRTRVAFGGRGPRDERAPTPAPTSATSEVTTTMQFSAPTETASTVAADTDSIRAHHQRRTAEVGIKAAIQRGTSPSLRKA